MMIDGQPIEKQGESKAVRERARPPTTSRPARTIGPCRDPVPAARGRRRRGRLGRGGSATTGSATSGSLGSRVRAGFGTDDVSSVTPSSYARRPAGGVGFGPRWTSTPISARASARWRLGDDERLVAHITSANVACGFHAGDFRVMEATVALCRRAGVAVGAQPGYPDLLGFGRRPLHFEPDEVESMVRYQIGALEAFCRATRRRDAARQAARRPLQPGSCRPVAGRGDRARRRAVQRRPRALRAGLVGADGRRGRRRAACASCPRPSPTAATCPTARSSRAPSPARSSPMRPTPPRRRSRSPSSSAVLAADGNAVTLRAESICCHGDTPGRRGHRRRRPARAGARGRDCRPPLGGA